MGERSVKTRSKYEGYDCNPLSEEHESGGSLPTYSALSVTMYLAWFTRPKGILFCSSVEGTVKIFYTHKETGFNCWCLSVLLTWRIVSVNKLLKVLPHQCCIWADVCWAPAGTAGSWTWRVVSAPSSSPSVWPAHLCCRLQPAAQSQWWARTWDHNRIRTDF